MSLFNWLIFLMKCAWHFSWHFKLNSRDIQKCNCLWVPSYDLFASARKAIFPAPTATGVHRLRNTWSSLLSQLVDNMAATRWVERHERYETFYKLYEYVCISLEAIVDHESHPHVYSSLSFTWDRETKTKTQQPQGLLANLKTFGFIFTFLITKNGLGTLNLLQLSFRRKTKMSSKRIL